MVGKLTWILFEIYRTLQQRKDFANRSRIDKVIAMVRVAQFFDSQCRPTCSMFMANALEFDLFQ